MVQHLTVFIHSQRSDDDLCVAFVPEIEKYNDDDQHTPSVSGYHGFLAVSALLLVSVEAVTAQMQDAELQAELKTR